MVIHIYEAAILIFESATPFAISIVPLNSCTDILSPGDDISGSGSGMCADDMCHRGPRLVVPVTDRPTFYLDPPENKKVKASANQNLPSITISLALLLVLLLRR